MLRKVVDRHVSQPWLEKLKLAELHRLAASLGSPSSGTKTVRIHSIQRSLQQATRKSVNAGKEDLSIISIDMGIRNLAYCHITSPMAAVALASDPLNVRLEAWQRVSIGKAPSNGSTVSAKSKKKVVALEPSTIATKKESFEPIDYAGYAYTFLRGIIDQHKPTHILIERQRFRSGGQAAVQEWTIRVGVFEGMLYAVLRTLAEQKLHDCEVVPILPVQVNQYWMGQPSETSVKPDGRIQAKAMKQHKIKLVGNLLEESEVRSTQMSLSPAALRTKDAFLAKLKGLKSREKEHEFKKLDDLSDCFLQGLAWVNWQRNRMLINQNEEQNPLMILDSKKISALPELATGP